jgi:hypothetical protein
MGALPTEGAADVRQGLRGVAGAGRQRRRGDRDFPFPVGVEKGRDLPFPGPEDPEVACAMASRQAGGRIEGLLSGGHTARQDGEDGTELARSRMARSA